MQVLGSIFLARQLPFLALAAALATTAVAQGSTSGKSDWVSLSASGKLVYAKSPTGDRIIDFSYAGYGGGGVAIPDFPVRKSVSPSGADDTSAIQAAIDAVSALPLVNGVRGAVLLKQGQFHCSRTLRFTASGVVLRGSGSAENQTIVEMTGAPHLAIDIGNKILIEPVGRSAKVTETYVPSGAQALTLSSASQFAVGDRVQIVRPVTPQWVHFMGMDELSRNGKKETWVSGDLKAERTIAAIRGNTAQLDVPLTDSYDANFLGPEGASVIKVRELGAIANIGIEGVRIVAPARKIKLSDKPFNGMQMNGVIDGWVRDVVFIDTTEAVGIGRTSRRITVEKVDVSQSTPIEGSAKPADFSLNGTQILVDRCTAVGDSIFYIATGPGTQGPNVILHCVFHGNGHIQPHQRWATGILIDSCQVPEGGIDLMNRGDMGSGHG